MKFHRGRIHDELLVQGRRELLKSESYRHAAELVIFAAEYA
jgi:hypothetical protein